MHGTASVYVLGCRIGLGDRNVGRCCLWPSAARSLCDKHSCAVCRFDGVLPTAEVDAAQPALAELNEKVAPLVEQYVALMEKIKLKDGIRMAMNVSFAGNKFFQVCDSPALTSSSICTCD